MDMEAEKKESAVYDTEQSVTYSAGEERTISCGIITIYINVRERKGLPKDDQEMFLRRPKVK